MIFTFFKKKIKIFYQDFLSLQGSPHRIAMGIAMGVFIGITPTIPLHTILACFFALILKQNLVTILIGTWIMNPLTMPLCYISEYNLGSFFLGIDTIKIDINNFNLNQIFQFGLDIFYPLQIGGLIMATSLAIPTYFIIYYIILYIRKNNVNCQRDLKKI